MNAHICKNTPTFRHLDKSRADYGVGRETGYVLTLKHNGSACFFYDIRQCVKRSRFSRSVRTDKGDYFAFIHFKRNAVQSFYCAVMYG